MRVRLVLAACLLAAGSSAADQFTVVVNSGAQAGLSEMSVYDGKRLVAKARIAADDTFTETFGHIPADVSLNEAFSNGKLRAEWRRTDRHLCRFRVFFPNGSPSLTTKGRSCRNGTFEQYYESGKKKLELTLREGLKDGVVRQYDADGHMKTEAVYRKDVADGPFTTYHPNGRVNQQWRYRNGQKDGASECFYPTGQRECAGSFAAGRMSGVWRRYYPDGKLMAETPYENGVIHGLSRIFHEDGRTTKEMKIYKAGAVVLTETYGRDGKLVERKQ